MKQRKLYMLLGVILVIGCLVATIGITFARYRTQWNSHMGFQVERVGRVQLGTVQDAAFTTTPATWTETDGIRQLTFAVSNGLSISDHADIGQNVRLQLVASLGAWQADSKEIITLTVGDKTYTATASPIPEGSTLHTKFGDGWVFRFVDADGNEYTGQLSGATFQYIPMELSMNSQAISDTSLLQLQVSAEIQ